MSAPRSSSLQTTRRKSRRAAGKRKFCRTRRPRIESLETRCLLAVSPPLLASFEGFNFDDNVSNAGGATLWPPDPSGAVGPNHVLNAGNVSIQWFTKDGTLQQHTSLRNFFGVSPAINPASALVFDPKVIYDQYNDRFVVLALELVDVAPNSPANLSRILMAVSDDSDPNGTWYFTGMNGEHLVPDPLDPATTLSVWSDYPGLAVDEEAIYVTVNLFEFTNGTPTGNRLWIVDKGEGNGGFYAGGRAVAKMYNPAADTNIRFDIDPNNPGILFRSMTPAHTFGNVPNGVGTWLALYDGYTLDGINELVDIIRVDDPLGTPVFTLETVNVGDIEDPLNPSLPPPSAILEASQRGSLAPIDGGDRRTLDAVWRNDQLYVSTVILPVTGPDANQVTAHWFQFDTSGRSVTLADQGNVSGDELELGAKVHTVWPALMVDANDNLAIGFSAMGPTLYPGSYYAVRAADDPPGTLRDARVLAAGQDSYDAFRWGDYGSVALDPSDGVKFWTYNMYSLPRQGELGKYGTRWGAFRLSDVPPGPPPGPTTITGFKWHDLDEDGFRDADEPGIANWLLYIDLDGDGQLDISEPTTRTNALGAYSFTVNTDGPVILRETLPPGWRQTFPGEQLDPLADPLLDFAQVVNIPAGGGGTIPGINFGNSDAAGFDYGDAPAPYPTLRIDNGPRHPILPGYGLGLLIDGEPDGQPSEGATGDDDNNLDDEDGVLLPNALTPGTLHTVRVTTTGRGFLQAWIDFNRDGDWNDPGEQIFQNLDLAAGTHSLSFVVPVSASPGTTYSRFRFGKQGNLGPTGASNREGEVEDYAIDILSDQPIAVDDAFTVEQSSSDNVFLVLANDIPSASGRANLRLSDVNTQGSSGSAVIDRNGTPNDFTDDFIRYTPAPGAFAPDAFRYTIVDVRSGQTDTATVSVTIIPFAGNVPVAVDDSYIFTPETPGASFDNLPVLNNDQRGPTGVITIPANGIDSTGTFGSVQLVTVSGQQQIRYSPNGFTGTDQFLYTIVDANNVTSTATVTIRVAPHTQDDIVRFRLETTDLNGTPISEIGQGLEFQVRAYVDDVRGEPGRPPLNNPEYPVASPDLQGVFSAYMDLLYDAGLVAYGGDAKLNFGPGFNQGQFVNSSIPGILDEVGALQGSIQDPLGPNEQLLYAATFTATAQGTVSFRSDPADVLPLHETSVNFPERAVDYPRIDFGFTSIDVVEAPTLVEIQLIVTDLNGNPLPNNRITAGSDFLVGAWVQDVRDDIADQFKGVFSAYLDVFYPQTLARPVASATNPFGFTINFAQPFTEGQKAEFIINSGIINEVGAFRATAPAQPGVTQPQLLFTTRFTALTPPGGLGSIMFTADPADLLPTNEVSLIRSGTGQIPDPGLSVSPAQIDYINSQVITIISGSGEGEFTNRSMPTDVNGDGFTSPLDALALINFLNAYGPMDLGFLSAADGEGEAGERYFFDTNGDKIISPLDVMGVINHLNAAPKSGGEGESAASAPYVEVAALTVDPMSAQQMIAAVDAQTTGAVGASDKDSAVETVAQRTVDPDAFRAQADDSDDVFAEFDLLLVDDLIEDVAGAWQDAGESLELLDLLV